MSGYDGTPPDDVLDYFEPIQVTLRRGDPGEVERAARKLKRLLRKDGRLREYRWRQQFRDSRERRRKGQFVR